MSQLAKYDLPSRGMTSTTKGLGFNWTTFKHIGDSHAYYYTYSHVIIDITGLNRMVIGELASSLLVSSLLFGAARTDNTLLVCGCG